jgi:hypothetical protein
VESFVASSKVVSELVVTSTDVGSRSLGVTLKLPTLHRVALTTLFNTVEASLKVVSPIAKTILVGVNQCVKGGQNVFWTGFAPKKANFSEFALTTVGVEFGFGVDQVGGASCGAPHVIVSYSSLENVLSGTGKALIAHVLPPANRLVPGCSPTVPPAVSPKVLVVGCQSANIYFVSNIHWSLCPKTASNLSREAEGSGTFEPVACTFSCTATDISFPSLPIRVAISLSGSAAEGQASFWTTLTLSTPTTTLSGSLATPEVRGDLRSVHVGLGRFGVL